MLRKQNQIISKVKSKYWQMTHEFGMHLPHSVEEALQIDAEMKMDHWRKALNKEMSKVKAAWKWHDGCTPDDTQSGRSKDFIGCQEIGCHIVFDVCM